MRFHNSWDALADMDLIFWWSHILRFFIVLFAAATTAAALATGFTTDLGHFHMGWMTGFFPPHRGYSAYVVTALLFLAPQRWLRGLAGVTLALSGARAAWIGALAGWGWSRGWRRPWLLGVLLAAAVAGGMLMKGKPQQNNDSVRVMIWRAALHDIAKHPRGTYPDGWCTAVAGLEASKAHSDLLQVVLIYGWAPGTLVVLLVALGLWRAPEGPWKDLVVALTAQSVIDNRLHHSACAALYALAWLGAWLERPPSEPTA